MFALHRDSASSTARQRYGFSGAAVGRAQIRMSGQSIGDVLTAAGITWGSFMGGFALNATNSDGSTGCTRTSTGLSGKTGDYIPHHAFFQYWASTLNANHTRPTSVAMIGHNGDAANHEYDIIDFWAAVKAHNMPAVSFLKAPAIQDTVKISTAAQSALQEAVETTVQTAQEARGGDHQAQRLLTRSQPDHLQMPGLGACPRFSIL